MIYCSLAKTVRKGKRERERESKRVNKEKISCPDSYSFYPRKRFVSYITISLVMTSAMREREKEKNTGGERNFLSRLNAAATTEEKIHRKISEQHPLASS